MQVVSHVAAIYEGFVHDKPFYADLQGGCCATKRRIDLRKLINNTMLCVEIDEDQHKKYIKEQERHRCDDLFMDFAGKYIFIRYNPDRFIDKYRQMKNPSFETRMEVLENAIDMHMFRIEVGANEDLVEIHHLFYDEVCSHSKIIQNQDLMNFHRCCLNDIATSVLHCHKGSH
jgi:hypothetical protein